MPDTALRNIVLAGRETHRTERGANRIPAVWRGTVVFIRSEDSASGARAGVYVRVPRLLKDQTLGPLPVVGTVPSVGDRVLVVAIEGRRDQLIILNPVEGMPDGLLDRLDAVETKADGLRSDLDAVDQQVSDHGDRLGTVEGVADDAAAAAGQAHSTANRALVLAGENVLEDPSFETSLWFDQFNNHGNQRYAFEPTGGPRTGDQAMAITRDDDATVAVNYPFDAVDVETDESLRLSIWYRTEGEINLDQGLGTRLRILIAGTNDMLAESVELEPSEDYQRVVVTFTAPPSIDQVSPALRVSHTQGTLIVDDVSFQQVGAAGEAIELAESNADAIAAIPGIDIDTSAGTRVSIGGHTVSYESGLRNITALFPDAAGAIDIERNGNLVTITFRAVSVPWDNLPGIVPQGFRPAANWGYFTAPVNQSGASVEVNFANSLNNNRVRFFGKDDGDVIRGTFTYPAESEFPTTLPGTPG